MRCICITTLFPNSEKRVDYHTYDEFRESFLVEKWDTDRQYNKVPTIFGKELPTLITTRNPFDSDCITRRHINYPIDWTEAEYRDKRFKRDESTNESNSKVIADSDLASILSVLTDRDVSTETDIPSLISETNVKRGKLNLSGLYKRKRKNKRKGK